jgi:hypothetical protein
MTPDYKALVDRYIAVWNLPDEDRAAGVAALFHEHVVYVDPLVAVRGREDLAGYIGQTRDHFPGLVFSAPGLVDGHHDQLRFVWQLGPPGAEPVMTGYDTALIARDSITAVYGFFD